MRLLLSLMAKTMVVFLLLSFTTQQLNAVNVTFQVDMTGLAVPPEGVHLAGSFQGWDPSVTQMTYWSSGIYRLTLDFNPGTYIEYKFVNGNAWGMDETVPLACGVDNGYGTNNRVLQVYDQDVVLLPVLFGQCVTSPVIYSISGSVRYLNQDETPLPGVQVSLFTAEHILVSQVTSDSQGNYSFSGLNEGIYYLSCGALNNWGGVNTNDCLSVLRHYVETKSLTGLYLAAADVNGSQYVNSVDAFLMLKRSAGLTSSFPVGDWVSDKPYVIYTGTGNVMQDIHVLCTGDVNGSYIPQE